MLRKPLPIWSDDQLEEQRVASREAFRTERIQEPIEAYNDFFETAFQSISELLEVTADLTDIESHIEELLISKELRRALRYTAAPPVSDDDLQLLADARLTKRYLDEHPEAHATFAEVITWLLDKKRLVWISEGREATEDERRAAVIATAALDAAQRTQSWRRNRARALEAEISEALRDVGYTQVAKRDVWAAGDWPAAGEYCGECKVTDRQADLVVTLRDSRYLPIEAKVSASALNSIKRLNNDSLAKFETWRRHFGHAQTLPIAVLEGDFAVERLKAAQAAGAGVFWRHDLDALKDFVS